MPLVSATAAVRCTAGSCRPPGDTYAQARGILSAGNTEVPCTGFTGEGRVCFNTVFSVHVETAFSLFGGA